MSAAGTFFLEERGFAIFLAADPPCASPVLRFLTGVRGREPPSAATSLAKSFFFKSHQRLVTVLGLMPSFSASFWVSSWMGENLVSTWELRGVQSGMERWKEWENNLTSGGDLRQVNATSRNLRSASLKFEASLAAPASIVG